MRPAPLNPDRALKIDLLAASFLALFLEVMLIRWVPSYERMLAYFTNCVLIAAFLGLGVGSLLSRRRDLMRYQLPLLFVLVAVAILFNIYVRTVPAGSDVLYSDYNRAVPVRIGLSALLVLFFVLTAAQFVPLGQRVGQDLAEMRSPIRGYIINLLGSLLGVAAFSAVSFLQLPPVWWFAVAVALAIWSVRDNKRVMWIGVVAGGLTVVAVWVAGSGFIWSPYHKIVLSPLAVDRATEKLTLAGDDRETNEVTQLPAAFGFHVAVDDDFLQMALNLRPEAVAQFPFLRNFASQYDMPYGVPGFPYHDVLIVGAGTGNDTAAALRGGAEHVDAVEIDPALVALGRAGHPEGPYRDPRVRVWVNDARAFFHTTTNRYDLVVFGLLDSHRLFSHMSSVRLDSFVFTVESFQDVRRLLKPDGLVVVQHGLGAEFMAARMYHMLREVFGAEPLLLRVAEFPGFTYVAGPGAAKYGSKPIKRQIPEAEKATDDWPFFYLKGRTLPREYAVALGLMLAVSVAAVAGATRGRLRSVDLHFFFLGAAFMLIETLSVTRFALLFGSTWIVNSIVFTAILLVVLVANFWMSRLPTINIQVLFAVLAALVLLNYWFPVGVLLDLSLVSRLGIAMALMGAPIFCAAFVFADSFKRTTVPELAYASNLLGAVIGGLAEYSTLLIGFRRQLLIALALYASSYVAWRFRARPFVQAS